MNIEAEPSGLKWLFLDMNSFFASCEQQENPALRAQPLIVVPTQAETTCAIAASYEAKRCGIKTGTLVKEARQLCPNLKLVEARPKVYLAYHNRFLDIIETCLPVEDVLSIDEVACRLDKTEQNPKAARQLALRIKTLLHERLGACLTCSIGIASNKLLGKLASDMQKPDGLTILEPQSLPASILHLPPQALSGIGPRMKERLDLAGLRTMAALWQADPATLRRVWGGVTGARFHALLHGADLPSPSRPRRSLSHQHVLPPQERTMTLAWPTARQLTTRVAARLRHEGFYCRRLILEIKEQGHPHTHIGELRFAETQDTTFFLRCLSTLWRRAQEVNRPLRLGITLADLIEVQKHQPDLFEKKKNAALSATIDALNAKFGRGAVAFGALDAPVQTSKIAFSRIPEASEL